jgi:hypothetical protein
MESFVINQPASHLLQPATILLFEILECNASLIEKRSELVTRELFYPIAWAYLRPLGTAHIHMSRTRLQLYKFKMNQKENRKTAATEPRTPDVFHEFNWPLKEKFPSFLEVNLAFCNRSVATIERKHFSRAPWEKEMALNRFKDQE